MEIINSTPSKKPKPTQQIITSTLGVSIPQHSLIPIASQEEIKSIFSTQIVDPIDWETFVNKPLMLLK